MTSISEFFPSKYVRAADLKGRDVVVTVDQVIQEDVGSDLKPVVYFRGGQKGLVLNRTNAEAIAQLYGDDTDKWPGARITLFATTVQFQGRSTPAIRVRAEKALRAPTTKQHHTEETPPPNLGENEAVDMADAINDEIPF